MSVDDKLADLSKPELLHVLHSPGLAGRIVGLLAAAKKGPLSPRQRQLLDDLWQGLVGVHLSKRCIHCRREMPSGRPDKTYCCKACRQAAYYKRKGQPDECYFYS